MGAGAGDADCGSSQQGLLSTPSHSFSCPPSSSRPPCPALLFPPSSFRLFPRHTEETKKALSAEYIADQKAVDAALLKALTPELKGYLATRFTLRDGDRPHLMKF